MPLGHPADQEMILYEDGTPLFIGPSFANLTQMNNTWLIGINKWDAAGGTPTGGTKYCGIAFAQPRNITACSFSFVWGTGQFSNIETSGNSTNFSDGTWNTRFSNLDFWLNATIQTLRQPWVVDWQNVTKIRWQSWSDADTNGLREMHLWGNYTRPGLALWDAALDQIMSGANLDFGDVLQGSNYTRQFRIKNNYSQTANNVVITAPAGGVGDVLNTLQFSDGGAYANSVTITSIAPGAISPVITARRTVGVAAPLQIGCARVTATAGSWT